MTLRDYQRAFVRDVQRAFAEPLPSGEPTRAVLGVMPTGAGKTAATIEGFMVPAAQRGRRMIFFADLGEILDDTAARVRAAGLSCGIIRAGHPHTPGAQAYVASLQTCARRLQDLEAMPDVDRVFVDEAHGSEAATVKAVLARFSRALVLGLTATPARGDGQGLSEFQKLVTGPSTRDLIAMGALVKPTLIHPVDRSGGAMMLSRGVARHPVEIMLGPARGRRCVVFAPNAGVAREIAEKATEGGHITATVLDDTDRDERRAVRARLLAGDVQSLVTCRALQKGFDAPLLDCVILTSVGSLTGYLQSIGRGLRSYEGKTDCVVYDLAGGVVAHGLPDADRVWTLDGAQGKAAAKAGLRRCGACHAVFEPATVCPVCGSRKVIDPRPLHVQRGELAAAGDVTTTELARRYIEQSTAVIVRRRGLPPQQAAWAARKSAPAWVKTALGVS
jgi:hypothetical protein